MKTICSLFFILFAFTMCAQFPIGHMSLNFKDASRTGGYSISGGIQMPGTGRDIGTEVYYPATVAGNNVAVASGTFPIVIIGHGFAMDWNSYDNMYNRLASLGYIVALPRTEGSLSPTHADFGADLKLLATLIQALNTSTVVGTTTFNTKVNPNVAIGGHSMGAGCSFLAAANNTSITCLFNCAAATTNPSSIVSASLVTVPSLLLSGQRDCVADTIVQNSHYTAVVASKKFHVILKGLTHCDFGNGSNFNCTFGQGTSGCSNTLSNTLAFNRYMTYLEPFLANQLKNNCSEGNRFMDSINSNSSNRVGRKITGTIASSVNVSITGQGAVCNGSQATLTASGANTYTWTNGVNNGVAFTPASTQNYSVAATNSVGCSKTFTANITVNPTPTVSAVSTSTLLCSGASSATLTANGANSYTWTAGPSTQTYVVSPSSSTTYTVTGINANGCVNTTTINQSVSTASITVLVTGSAAVCGGSQATLTASGATTYSWSGGITNGVTFTPSMTQNYTVTATNASGCIKTAVAGITVNPTPNINAASSNPLLCYGSSATLTASGAGNYTWTAGPSTPSYVINPTTQTTYTVTGIDVNGCSGTTAITQSVSVCSGINELNSFADIIIYPNPVQNKLSIKFHSIIDSEITIDLMDVSGKSVLKPVEIPNKTNDTLELNMDQLRSGLYFLKVSGSGYNKSLKIVKQ